MLRAVFAEETLLAAWSIILNNFPGCSLVVVVILAKSYVIDRTVCVIAVVRPGPFCSFHMP